MRILYTSFLILISSFSWSQLINYKVEIVSFKIIGCDDGFGDDEEPTWKLWGRDDINTSWIGGICQSSDGNITHIFNPTGTNKDLLTVSNTSATLLELKFEAWEDDDISNSPGSTDRCTFNSGDDCHELWAPLVGNTGMFPAINIMDGNACQWTHYDYVIGDFGFEVKVKWEYAVFSGGPSQSICGTDGESMNAQGSGIWTVYSGSGGGFSNNTDPEALFSGVEGINYQVLWSTLPGCLTAHTPDTVNVFVYELPVPELESNVSKYCEGQEVTFDASNANSYDFYVNSLTTIVESNNTGQFDHVLQMTDHVIYVESSTTHCTGMDSINFTVNASPDPIIELNYGVLETTTSYPFNQWYYNGNVILGATTDSYVPTQNGTYMIEVANDEGCISTATYILNNLNVSDLSHEFTVYPNPANEFLFVDGIHEQLSFEIRDNLGRTVKKDVYNGQIEISDLVQGMYFLIIINEEGRPSIHQIEIIR